MMNPIDIHSVVASESANQHRPEGVSVLVVAGVDKRWLVEQAAFVLAAEQYPGIALTGKVLFVGIDEMGEGRHEVVLEVA